MDESSKSTDTIPATDDDSSELADIQSLPDHRRMDIDKVGIKEIRYPILVKDRTRGWQNTVANVNMYVNLPHHFKGTHMSRFIEVLSSHESAISVDSLPDILRTIRDRLDAEEAHIQLSFPYFMERKAPVSGATAVMDYEVGITGVMSGDSYESTLTVHVPVTTLCPCSKTISEYGAHNQRSLVTVKVRPDNGLVWLEELIELVERNASCALYPILKRPDEKYVTEKAYDNPRFVEDMVRAVASELQDDSRIAGFSVESENYESIHNHSAYACIKGGEIDP